MFWNCNPTDVPSIKILAPEPEPHSPRERLRKAISKMCLYTCPRDRLSTPNHTPKRNSLDQVVWEVMDRVRGEKLVLQQDPGFGPGPQGDPVPPISGTKLPTSSCPCVFCSKEETQQGMPTLKEPLETLDSNLKIPCCAHSLPRADIQWSTDPAQVKRELWSLQAINKEAHSAKDETFWKRKSRARKSLFQKNPVGRKVKSLDLSIIQQKWKQGQERTELHRSLTQQLQDTSDLEVQSNSEEEESHWPSRPRNHQLYQTFAGKDSRSFAGFHHHHHSTCSDSSSFIEEPNSHLSLQESVQPPTSSSCSLALQTPDLSRRKAAWYTGQKTRVRDLESPSMS
ncbi:protein TESPA1 isoform X1 [Hippopotamus amphibius kiboko]|nr:protein TESPA1 isoform X1 [Hippopotamus amphibius kiboko]